MTTTLRDKWRLRVGGYFLAFVLDVADGVFDCGDLLGILVRDVDVECFFERHHQFDDVQRICAEIVDKRRCIINLRLIDTQLLNDDLLHLLCNGHESSKTGSKMIDSSIAQVSRRAVIRFLRRRIPVHSEEGMRVLGLSLVAAESGLQGQTPLDHTKVIDRLGAEADAFERTAYRIVGRETLTQIVPNGVRIGKDSMEEGETARLHPRDRVRVWLCEPRCARRFDSGVRRVLTIDGLRWKKESRSLHDLARQLKSGDEKAHQRTLETFEEHGLTGFVSDLGQLILLFARGGASRYEFQFEKFEEDGSAAYSYHQLDGKEALTVFGETLTPVRQKMHGRVWVQPFTYLPLRISVDSTREYEDEIVTDQSIVAYNRSTFGTLLPERIVHQQHLGKMLLVTDEYEYSAWKQVLPTPGSRLAK